MGPTPRAQRLREACRFAISAARDEQRAAPSRAPAPRASPRRRARSMPRSPPPCACSRCRADPWHRVRRPGCRVMRAAGTSRSCTALVGQVSVQRQDAGCASAARRPPTRRAPRRGPPAARASDPRRVRASHHRPRSAGPRTARRRPPAHPRARARRPRRDSPAPTTRSSTPRERCGSRRASSCVRPSR
jgi:hypothetical protein